MRTKQTKLTKEKTELLLNVLINAKDKQNLLPNGIQFYCDMLDVPQILSGILYRHGIYKGVGKQKKEIIINAFDNDLVDEIMNSYHKELSTRASKYKKVNNEEKEEFELTEIVNTLSISQQKTNMMLERILKELNIEF